MNYGIVSCYTSADVRALQARSDKRLYVNLVSLESVRVARESYAILHQLLSPTPWLCGQIELLSLVAGVALELLKVEDDLLPRLLVEGAKLEGDVVEAILLLRNSSMTLLNLEKVVKESFAEVDKSFDDGISGLVNSVGIALKDTANQVLIGGQTIDWLQVRAARLLQAIRSVLATPVHFPDSE